MNRKKVLIFGLIGVGTGLAVKKLWSLMTISDRVSFVISSFKVHKIVNPKNLLDIVGYQIQLKVGIRIYNPSNYTVSLQIPSVKVMYRNREIAFSKPDGTVTAIGGNSTNEKYILIDVPLHALTNIGIVNDMLSNSDKLAETLSQHLTFAIVAKVNGVTVTSHQSLNGTGLALSAGPRTVKDGTRYNRYFPKVDNQRKRIVRDGDVDNVVEMAIGIVRVHYKEAMPIAKVLQGRSIKETASNIFDFAYSYLQYRRDKPGVEELRTPARSWYDGQVRHKQMGVENAGIDCDDYSIFCGSILQCLGIPFKFRITKYNGRDYFQHIYVYIPATDKNPEIIIDPVLDRFDYEKPYSEQKDNFNMASLYAVEGLAGMPIEMLSGIDDDGRLVDIVTGRTLMEGFDGLGNIDTDDFLNRTLHYLIQTRDAIVANPQMMGNYTKDVASLVNMLNDAIKYWNTPLRDQVLERLEKYEELLEKTGVFKPVQGLEGGLNGGFFKKIGKAVKKVGKIALKVAPLAVSAFVAVNPLTTALTPLAAKATSFATKALSSKKVRTVKNIVSHGKEVKQALSPSAPASVAPVAPVVQPAPVMQVPVRTMVAPMQANPPVAINPMAPLPLTPHEEIQQSYMQPVQQQSFVENQTRTTMSTQTQEPSQEGQRPGFFARNKKAILITGGAALVATAAYVLLKKDDKRSPASLPAQSQALAGLPVHRKKKSTKKSKPKAKAKAKPRTRKKTTTRKKAKAANKKQKAKRTQQRKKTRRGVRKVTLR
jgi:hypothetical protein